MQDFTFIEQSSADATVKVDLTEALTNVYFSKKLSNATGTENLSWNAPTFLFIYVAHGLDQQHGRMFFFCIKNYIF